MKSRRAPAIAAALATAAAALALAWPAAPPANAALIDSALGIPCLPGPDGVRICSGTVLNRVPSWDGVPLDVELYLPPASQRAPYPLIVGLHGFGLTKLVAFDNDDEAPLQLKALRWAQQGYAVMAYSARGIGFSCGLVVGGLLPGCGKGWLHLADTRYEVRDTQHFAGLLADAGLVKPRRIGVTGSSYGGGQSLMLATLRDRVMLPSGRLVEWRSPAGTPMRIAAAAPRIGWSDLASALVPNGRTLDYRSANPYGHDVGIVKQSYLEGLYLVAETGFVAPEGRDPSADLRRWKRTISAGEPYDPELAAHILRQFSRYRSPYEALTAGPEAERVAPAPTVIYNAWTDDIMPPAEAIRYYNRARALYPGARVGMVLSDGFAHNRGSILTPPTIANREREALFARYLKGDESARPLRGVIASTQGCNGEPALGPFETASWHAQHPGEVRATDQAEQTFGSGGGKALNSLLTDPFTGLTSCPTISSERDPGAATYATAPAAGDGFTLLGSPTVTATLSTRGEFPQIVARLWDVSPDGTQTMVQHSPYRPRPDGRQTFQLQPSGWHFRPGHVAKLELLGRDVPYAQASNGRFEITVRDLALELPVRERPDGAQVKPYAPPGR